MPKDPSPAQLALAAAILDLRVPNRYHFATTKIKPRRFVLKSFLVKYPACSLLVLALLVTGNLPVFAATVSTSYGITRQVNIDASVKNIPGDAANEPSMCSDPTT